MRNTKAKIKRCQKKKGAMQDKLSDTCKRTEELQTTVSNLSAKNEELQQTTVKVKLQKKEAEDRLRRLKSDVSDFKTTSNPRNVKREETKKKQIVDLKRKIDKKSENLKNLSEQLKIKNAESAEKDRKIQMLEEAVAKKVKCEKIKKVRAQKIASKYRRKTQLSRQSCTQAESAEVKKLTTEVYYLENKNEEMKEQIADILDGKAVKTFQDGRYSNVMCEVCYSLVAKGVSTREFGNTIQKIVRKFGNCDLEQVPKKSVVSKMIAECDAVGKIGAAKKMLEGHNNTLHLDGTRKRFNEYSGFQVTSDGSQGLSLGFSDMAAGSADDYMCATKYLFSELTQLLVPKDASSKEIEMKQGQLLKTIKNVQSDWHVVNKNYFEQLKIYRASFLPKIMPNFHELSAEEVSKVVRMN